MDDTPDQVTHVDMGQLELSNSSQRLQPGALTDYTRILCIASLMLLEVTTECLVAKLCTMIIESCYGFDESRIFLHHARRQVFGWRFLCSCCIRAFQLLRLLISEITMPLNT